MFRPLALDSPTPSRLWLRHKHSGYRGLAAAHLRLSLTCIRGPARSLADRRGTTLRLQHRRQLRNGSSKKMTRTCDHDDARTATQHLREDSSRCRRVGAVVLPNHPQLVVACEAVLEEAARKRTLRPPHWRRIRALSQREPISQSRSRRRLFLRCVQDRRRSRCSTSSYSAAARLNCNPVHFEPPLLTPSIKTRADRGQHQPWAGPASLTRVGVCWK